MYDCFFRGKYLFTLILFPCFTIFGLAQTTITSSQFFQQQLQKAASLPSSYGAIQQVPSTFNPSWIDEIDIRTETRDFDLENQQYLVRISPTTKKIRTAQKQLMSSIRKEAKYADENIHKDIIDNAYETWLDAYEAYLELQVNRSLLLVYSDIETVLFRLASQEKVKARDIMEVQEDIGQTEVDIQLLERKINHLLEGKQPIFDDLVSFPTMIDRINNAGAKVVDKSQNNLGKSILEAEIALEEAEGQRIFDFLQIQYNGPHTDVLSERISIGAGVKIPFSSDRAIKLEELKIEQAVEARKLEVNSWKLEEERIAQKKEFQAAVGELKIYEQFQSEQAIKHKKMLSQLMKLENVDPLLPLYQQVTERKQELELIEMKLAVYKSFLNYLEVTGDIYQMPFFNHMNETNN